MRKNRFLLTMAMIALALNACSGRASAAPLSTEETISSAYTAVALTSMAQFQTATTEVFPPTATATVMPTSIPTMTAPATAVMVRPPDEPDNASPSKTSNCDSSTYVDDVSVPDGTVFEPGETFTKTWKIKNTGICTWNKFYAITFSGEDDMSGETTPLRRAIPSNGAGNVSVELTAPGAEGTYTGYWVMINSSGTPFGNIFYVQIVVKSNNSTEDE